MNPGLHALKPYPFERLAEIRSRVPVPADRALINLSIGEPQHATPACIRVALIEHLAETSRYPVTRGLPELRHTIVHWAARRFHLPEGSLDAERHVLPVNGTREALFGIAQTLCDATGGKTLVGMPNPFYQIYEGAALLAGVQPYYLPCPAARGFRPDWSAVPDEVWRRMALVYVCSPANPSGAVLSAADFATLTRLADRHDFIIIADECYSEIYPDEARPPLGLLQWCAASGRRDFARCLVMHSLSKRSNAPGLRSGFVAGEARLIEAFLRYRTYQGGAMALPVQYASIAAWSDESHVIENRARYRAKFASVIARLGAVLDLELPQGGFYLWPALPIDGVTACERLLGEAGVLVLPGSYLARDGVNANPGEQRIRIALVADLATCEEAADRMYSVIQGF